MAAPCELSLEEIRKYLIENGGTARNHDLVKHFKKFLTDPDTRVEARNKFKEYVNSLATIKNEEGEKYLVLKKKYRNCAPLYVTTSSSAGLGSPNNGEKNFGGSSTPISPLREPPPYRPPPLASPNSSSSSAIEPRNLNLRGYEENCEIDENLVTKIEDDTELENSNISSPPVPPRRKSQDKIKIDNNKENVVPDKSKIIEPEATIEEDDGPASATTSAEQLSVRERMQKFNKMASETDIQGRINGSTTPTKKKSDKGADEDDRASVASQLDGKSREWLVRAAQGDYQGLAKLAAEEPRLARLRDPSSYTALHWGAKHGNEDIVKLIAGTYKDYIKGVNETTGYTALHIAMQFDHENIFNLLVQVYGANQDIRDYSGKKARQYLASQEAAVSQDTFRKIKARKKHAEKDLGFLRIGSLNVRVKRTTEAFSQFLGVATSNAATTNEKMHKTWGSADNIQTDNKTMPPPKYAPIKKRRSRRAQDFISPRNESSTNHHTNNSHQQRHVQVSQRAPSQRGLLQEKSVTNLVVNPSQSQNDSDSDNACGFDSAWRGSALM